MNSSAHGNEEIIDPDPPEWNLNLKDIYWVIWLVGICFSSLALVLQISLFVIVPSIRRVRMIILTHMTVARLLCVILEFFVTYTASFPDMLIKVIFCGYAQADSAFVCWTCVFTMNFYYKVVIVFPPRKFPMILTSLLIWSLTLLLGVLMLLTLTLTHTDLHYVIYDAVKLVLLIINALIMIDIYRRALARKKVDSKFHKTIKICIVALIMISVASLQILISDSISLFVDEESIAVYTLSIINSFQVLAVTILFWIIANNCCDKSLMESIYRKIKPPN